MNVLYDQSNWWFLQSLEKHITDGQCYVAGQTHLLCNICIANNIASWVRDTVLFSSDRQHLSYDTCLEVREEIIKTVYVLYCVLKLCIVISTLRWAVLTVLWIGFCHSGPISLCIDSFVFMFVFFLCYFVILHMCCIIVTRWVHLVGLKPNPWTSSFSALTLLVGPFDL